MRYNKKNLASILNKVIDIYDYTENITNEGRVEIIYKKYTTIFSSVKAISSDYLSNEFFLAMQLSLKEYYFFLIRNEISVKAKMRIKYNNEFFEIKKIVEEDQVIRLITLKISGEEIVSS